MINKKEYITRTSILCMIILFIFLSLKHIEYKECSLTENDIQLPIIMYHNISSKSNKCGKYTVLNTQFENDLKYIRENNFNTITMTELINYVKNNIPLPEKPIIITFDDSYESFYTYAYPLLKEYNFKAVMSVIGSYTDEFTQTEDHNIDYSHLNWGQIKELSKSGYVEIQNHTYNMHQNGGNRKGCRIEKYESAEHYKKAMKEDLIPLQEKIKEVTGITPNTFTYPYGCICDESVTILKEIGFLATLTCTEQINIINKDSDCLFYLGRFNRASGETSEQFFIRVFKDLK